MKNKNQFRQGDVFIERVKNKPATKGDASDKGRVILAHGEVTGHAHEVENAIKAKAKLLHPSSKIQVDGDLDSSDATRFVLDLGKQASVTHQEHSVIPLEKGSYVVTRQREYSPEAIRNVAD